MPDADYKYWERGDVPADARMVQPRVGPFELYQVGDAPYAGSLREPARAAGYGALEQDGAESRFLASPEWLRMLSAVGHLDLGADLSILRDKYRLARAEVKTLYKNGLPAGMAVEIAGPPSSVEGAQPELMDGILPYYARQVEWSASEMP